MKTKVEWQTVAEVIEELGVSRDTFDRWVKSGRAPIHRRLPNGRLLFDSRDVEEWLDGLVVR